MRQSLAKRVRSLTLRAKIIIATVTVLVVGGGVAMLVLVRSNQDRDQAPLVEGDDLVAIDKEAPSPPASSTEELRENQSSIAAAIISGDKIEFTGEIAVDSGEVLAIWVYSQPRFMGFFEIKEVGGIKYIEGLAKALERMSVSVGAHNIAIVTSDGRPIGYIDIFIGDDGRLQDTDDGDSGGEVTEKDVVEEEKVPFMYRNEDEVNMLRGTTRVVQAGADGVKKVTYRVKYNKDGKEVSRVRVDEEVTRRAVEQITKVGVSDFNINKDVISEYSGGAMCPMSEVSEEDGCIFASNAKSFFAFKLKGRFYLFCVSDSNNCSDEPMRVNIKPAIDIGERIDTDVSALSYALYIGVPYVFDYRMGSEGDRLTEASCLKYGLSCGRW